MTVPPTEGGSSPVPERPRRRPFEGPSRGGGIRGSRELQIFLWIACLMVVALMLSVFFLQGARLFVSSRPAVPASPAAAVSSSPRVTVSAEEEAARDLKLHTLFEGSLADTRDGDGFAETPGYRHLLEILKSYSAEDFAALPRRRLDWGAAMADPGAWRGEVVWMRGIILERYASRLREPVLGVQDVTQGILADADGSNGVLFEMIDEPPDVGRRDDAVDLVGVFYRTISFPTSRPAPRERSRDGRIELPAYRKVTPEGEVQEAPYLVVKLVLPVVNPRRDASGLLRDHAAAILVGMGLAFAAGWLIVYSVQRRSRARRGPVPPRRERPSPLYEKSLHGDPRT